MSTSRVFMMLVLLTMPWSRSIAAPVPAVSAPNIILLLTDDQDWESMSHLPRLERLLTDEGATFSSYFVSDSLCCPSRSTILRGQYVHNHHVLGNTAPDGGFAKWKSMGHETSTIATWLQGAGYATGLFGKYMNGYPGDAGELYVPPGWSSWVSPVGGDPYQQYHYELNENGRVVSYGGSAKDYLGDVLATRAEAFIRANAGRAFFLYLAPFSPHTPAIPPNRHRHAFRRSRIPRTPSFNARDVSTKAAWVRNRPLLTRGQIGSMDRLYRRRLQSLLGVEDMLERVIMALRDSGQLERTYIVFASDNGLHYGQHRLLPAKGSAYDEDIRVPLVIRGPGIASGSVIPQLALNTDLAPTIAELAGVPVPDWVDGRSLVPLLGGSTPTAWRASVLIEHMRNPASTREGRDPDDETPRSIRPPLFFGVREQGRTYVEYATGERELYDLATDPYELKNLIPPSSEAAPGSVVEAFSTRIKRLLACAGASCRQAEDEP